MTTILKARDAESALAVIDSGIGIDVLFTDVVMPGNIPSTDLARRAQQKLPRLAVLFTSGYIDNTMLQTRRFLNFIGEKKGRHSRNVAETRAQKYAGVWPMPVQMLKRSKVG
jgi:CheY-like chemotaxis protein